MKNIKGIDLHKIISEQKQADEFFGSIVSNDTPPNSSEMAVWLDSLDKSEFRRVMSFLKDISQRKGV